MNTNLQIVSTQTLLRTNPAHIGDSKIQESGEKSTFENYLLDAINYVNDKQQASTDMVEKLITDPESVDVHDVTTAMAEANLSLSLAQNVIDRITKAWTEITTTR